MKSLKNKIIKYKDDFAFFLIEFQEEHKNMPRFVNKILWRVREFLA